MYKVEYKRVCDIVKQYTVIGDPISRNFIYECILIDGSNPTAIALKSDIPLPIRVKQPLKDLIRCYIIRENDILALMTFSKFIDRYR